MRARDPQSYFSFRNRNIKPAANLEQIVIAGGNIEECFCIIKVWLVGLYDQSACRSVATKKRTLRAP